MSGSWKGTLNPRLGGHEGLAPVGVALVRVGMRAHFGSTAHGNHFGQDGQVSGRTDIQMIAGADVAHADV